MHNVINIGSSAFYGCSGITGIVDLHNVTSIGSSAFYGCSGITGIADLHVTSIGSSAFYGCSGITGLVDLNNATYINTSAFAGCSGISSINVLNTENIGESAFYGCTGITGAVDLHNARAIGASAFSGCNGIDTLILGTNVNTIGSSAFSGCDSLSVIYWNAENITSYPTYSSDTNAIPFQGQQNCRIVFGNTVQGIPAHAFYNNNGIVGEITLPHTCTSIGANAFQNCQHILSVDIDNASIQIGSNAFEGCSRLVDVNLGANASRIGSYAFNGCYRLNFLYLGDSLDSIGDYAFNGCVRLHTPTFPPVLMYIGARAFAGCELISGDITIPDRVTTIGNYAFSGCSGISSLIMKPQTPPTIYANTFASINSNIPVYVPCGRVLYYYVTDYWENFPNLLESQPFEVEVASSNNAMGTAVMTTPPTCSNPQTVVTAHANNGFHFVRWSDGSLINPRLLQLTSDTSLVAEFAVNQAYLTIQSCDTVKGNVSGSGLYTYSGLAVLTATANTTYHFLRWNDGNTDNPRYVFATQDSTFTAIFVPNASNITVGNFNPEMGTVSGSGLYYYLQQISIMASPYYGYHFFQWSDGNMQNPRPILVNCDTSFMAYFAPNIYAVAINSNSSAMGTTTGTGSYHYNMFMSFSATPNYGYHFTQWNDGITSNPRTLTVTQDTSFTAQFAANTYSISVVPNDPVMGGAYGAGTFTYNTQTTISAAPTYGYHFVQWNDGNTENPRTVSVTQNVQYVAEFAVNFYTLSVGSTNPAIGTASGSGNYSYNSIINLVAYPNYGYHFTQWSDGNTDNPRTITVMQNATYTAQFAINSFPVSVGQNNVSMGEVAGGGSYIYNTLATITATPYYGYHFTQWNDGNTENPRTIVVTQGMSFVAQFDYNTYQLQIHSNNITAGYTLGSGTYPYNSVVAMSATPVPHYHFVSWDDEVVENPRNVILQHDTTFTAIFDIDRHTISAISDNPQMGAVQGAGSYSFGSSVQITAVPAYGYHFVRWNDGNTQNPRPIWVEQDTGFVALFAINNYTATILSNDTTKGTVSNSGSYPYLTSVSIAATPQTGYHFVQWNDGTNANPRTLVLTSDTTITAYFAVNVHTLMLNVNDAMMGYTSGSGSYDYAMVATAAATANEHHHFIQWSDGNTSNPRLITMTDDVSLTAQFVENEKFTINVLSMDTAMGVVAGAGEYYVSDQISIMASAKEHYRFAGWTDGVTDNPRTVTVLQNATFVALFEPKYYEIIALSMDDNKGSVSGGGTYAYHSNVQLTAIANTGYHFVCWNDGDSNATRSILVEEDAVYVATFAEGVSVQSQYKPHVRLYPNPTSGFLKIEAEDILSVEVLDTYGRLVLRTEKEQLVNLSQLSSGLYIVRIETKDGMVEEKVVKR